MNDSKQIRELYRQRPKSWFLRLSLAGLAAFAILAWYPGQLPDVLAWIQLDPQWSDVFSERRAENLSRFIDKIYPYDLRDEPFSLAAFWKWFADIWKDKGYEATTATFSISVVAILMAGLGAVTFVFAASRNVASPEPFLPAGDETLTWKRFVWVSLRTGIRSLFILVRAIPEYIWAFLLVAMLGLNAWPAILALALHNFGILGKLGAEVVENTNPSVPRALRGQGMSRIQISAFALFPMSFSKWLLFFFYRWETCIREATVLGMLGISSLGFWVLDARARRWYDEMLVFILLGAFLVLIGDLVSAVARRMIRRV